ncbi:glycosyltransferase [Actinomyces sp. HMSC065F11]|uniref:glycosyltransferase n=1 Tax=Actinomyces sp. HMSC065F11 TaxID=1739395 RepID=UPI0008A335C6|nr:glycosyltransferase [Actinomyces sp. HMSC065F11]OFR31181.1 hypothetical protein HMPREF2891_03820 [Actinomyces sp. HMSC065F11]
MIFHAAFSLNSRAAAASALRPVRMYEAFEALGYEVFDLTGSSAQRRQKFNKLKAMIRAGEQFEFAYSESATIPAMIGDASHFPHMFLDAEIFAFLRKNEVPVSVFYRDLYWVYDEYIERVGRPLGVAMRILYKYELAMYRRFANVIFVPSLEMAAEIAQLRIPKVKALPPGGEIVDSPVPPSPLRLFYVGGIGAHYKLHELVKAVSSLPNIELTVCTGKDLWEGVKDEYDISVSNVRVVHASGKQLDEYYDWANVAAIAVDPSHYWSFAVPVKLFEYVGRGKPIIATDGTLTSRIVKENDWGWVVPNDSEQIIELLKRLELNPDEISRKAEQVQCDRHGHSWEARAAEVKRLLVED